jgi:Ala-tRNA(Pro) deacylase
MAVQKRLQELLDDAHVEYTHHAHPTAFTARELAHAEHVPEHQVAKTVVFWSEEGFGMAVLPADSLVDLQELRVNLGFDRLRLATEREMVDLFPDCELGAMPPFGNLFGLPVYADGSLAGEMSIAFHAGTHRDVIYMRFQDFEALAKPRLVQFARYATA